MKIIAISYYFPPFSGGASERIHNFVKYLPMFGIEPTVVSVRSEFYEAVYCDNSLENQYDPIVKIIRTDMLFGKYLKKQKDIVMGVNKSDPNRSRNAFKWVKKKLYSMLIPDLQILWQPYVLAMCNRITNQEKYDLIFSTGAPFSSHLFAAFVSLITRIPLVLDYRDLWTENVFENNCVVRYVNFKMERFALKCASAVIFTNKDAAEAVKSSFRLDSSKVKVIENGYDNENNFEHSKLIKASFDTYEQCCTRPILINYIGSLTRYRSPSTFFEALLHLREEYPTLNLEIKFYGYAAQEHINLSIEMGVDDIVSFKGVVSKSESIAIMHDSSDVLLVIQREVEGGSTAIPGKLYEYLATGIPILCLDQNNGPTTQFLEGMGSLSCAEYDDVDEIFKKIYSLINSYKQHQSISLEMAKKVKCYNRKDLTERLSEILYECVV